ncbi:MAG: FxsA family protein [Sulfurospirillaceae bacterium]|nr:FxsA family protein [Sulfurospirillaceae bacterium]
MRYFLVYLFLEVFVSVNISSKIGALWTFVEIILSAVVGVLLLANAKNTLFESMQALQNRVISMDEFKKLNAFSILGALFLILPGFFGDIVGLFLQFGFFATLFAKKVLHVRDVEDEFGSIKKEYNDEVIDVEIIEHSVTHK